MGACESTTSKHMKSQMTRAGTLKKTNTLHRGETVFGKRGDQSE